MQCPRCNNHLVILEYNGVEVDHCYRCGGTWLDTGEIQLLFHNHTHLTFYTSELTDKISITIKCPYCKKVMPNIHFENEEKIVINKCPDEHGLWFDKGELEIILSNKNKLIENKILNQLSEVFKKLN